MYCSKCGMKMDENAKFCKNCGAQLSEQPNIGKEAENSTSTINHYTPKKNRKNIVLIVLIAIVIIILLAFMFIKNYNNNNDDVKNNIVSTSGKSTNDDTQENSNVQEDSSLTTDEVPDDSESEPVYTTKYLLQSITYAYLNNGDTYRCDEYSYDEYGNITLHSVYNEDGDLIYEESSEYDENGKIISYKCFSYSGENADDILNTTEFSYKSSGTLEQTITYDSNGIVIASSDCEDGTYTIPFNYNDDTISYIQTYDAENYCLVKAEYYFGGTYAQLVYEYDSYGNITKETLYNSDGTVFSEYEYEYILDSEETLESIKYYENGEFVEEGSYIMETDEDVLTRTYSDSEYVNTFSYVLTEILEITE